MTSSVSKGWFIWGIGTFFYLYQFILRASPNVMADQLMVSFAIQASSLGIFASCYYAAYTTLQIPLGILLDKWGPQAIIRFAITMCLVGVLLFLFADVFWLACLARVLIGLGASGVFLSTVSLARHWLPVSKVAFAVGTTITFGKFGGLFANLPLALMVENQGWRKAFFFLLLLGGVLFLLIWLFVKNKREPHDTTSEKQTKHNILRILSNPHIWYIGLYGCLTYVPLSVFTDTWGVSFLMKRHDTTKEFASIGISLLFIGTGIGAPLIALLSDRLHQRKSLMTLSAIGSALVCTLLVFGTYEPIWISFVLTFLVGLFMTGQTLVFTVGAESMPPYTSGLVTGFVNTLVMTGGIVFQPLVGFILDALWDGQIQDNVPLYTLENYQLALLLLPLCMGAALFTLLFIPETHPKHQREHVIFGET